MPSSTVKYVFLFVIIMARADNTSGQLAAIAQMLPEIITVLENVTDLDWQRNLQNTQNQIASSQNQTAATLTQVSNLLQMELHTITAAMTTMVSLLEKQQETLENISLSMPLLLKQQENQIELLRKSLPSPQSDCSAVAAQGYNISRPYTITPQDGMGSLTVYCDLQTAGGGWTVFQRRYDGSLDFFLGWDEYEQGFGSPYAEHWIGLREIHRLTRNGKWTLRIDMEAFDGDVAYAEYESFSIGDAESNYTLSIGAYTGTARDALTYNHNNAFSTKDRDHDASSANCAEVNQGAWWYFACSLSNLNGLYHGSSSGNSLTGIVWTQWKSFKSLKRSEMKMRRVQ